MSSSLLWTKEIGGRSFWLTHGPKQPWRIEVQGGEDRDFATSDEAWAAMEALDGVPFKRAENGMDLSAAAGFGYFGGSR